MCDALVPLSSCAMLGGETTDVASILSKLNAFYSRLNMFLGSCRGYYKCSSMRGCPARKHVERCLEDPSMLIVTYEGEHNHPTLPSQSANAWNLSETISKYYHNHRQLLLTLLLIGFPLLLYIFYFFKFWSKDGAKVIHWGVIWYLEGKTWSHD